MTSRLRQALRDNYQPGPVDFWLWATLTEFINGFIAGLGGGTFAGIGTAAATRIRLALLTVGGTPGAVYVSAKTNGTSFVITSTSAGDTSVIYYEAFEP